MIVDYIALKLIEPAIKSLNFVKSRKSSYYISDMIFNCRKVYSNDRVVFNVNVNQPRSGIVVSSRIMKSRFPG